MCEILILERRFCVMKKFLGLLVVVVGMFTLAACDDADNGENAFALLMRAETEMADVDSMVMETEMNMVMELFGQPMYSTSNSRAYTVQVSPTEFEMRVETVTETMDMEIPSTMYFRDGMMYMDMMGERTKFEIPFEEAMQMANVDGFEFEFDESAIISHSVSANGDNRELEFVLDFGSVMDSLSGEVGSMMEMFGDMEGMFDDLTVEMTVVIDADYQIVSMMMAYEMEIEGITTKIEMISTVVQTGGVEITFPDNLDEFEEMDSMMFDF